MSISPEASEDPSGVDEDSSDAAEADDLAAELRFPVVAVGASAGGLDALERMLARLGGGAPALVVLQHMPRGGHEQLIPLLQRACSIPVVAITDGMALSEGTVYVAPADAEVRVAEGVMRLRQGQRTGRSPLPVDALFSSLAVERGPSAMGVVLSGTGSDGSLGIRAIKRAGGITFVQNPEGAAHRGMPEAALATELVDFCLPPAAIGDEIMRLGKQLSAAQVRSRMRFNEEHLGRLFERLCRMSGVDFSTYKISTVQRRVERRMALLRLERPADYLTLVEENEAELQSLFGDLLIGVTSFFRDGKPLEVLVEEALPKLLDKRSREQPIRAWVAGCATGEEAYSLVICLLEYTEQHCPGQRIQVFATDIDESALSRARHGVYSAQIENNVSPERLQRFFVRTEGGYQVSRKLRELVVFARHNLGKDTPFSRLDLVTCRNVLIYLQPSLQKRVMRVFHYALVPRGCLLLGTAESIGDASELFSLLDRNLKLYVKKNGASPGVFDFSFGRRADGRDPMTELPPERKAEPSLQQLADRRILDKYGPPGVLVDEQLNVLQFRGHTGPYLSPSPGAATLNMLRLVRPELLVTLKKAIQRAQQEGISTTAEPATLAEGRSQVVMDVIPVDGDTYPRCLLVLFRDAAANSIAPRGTGAAAPEVSDAQDAQRSQLLERELLSTKEYLETIIQELATSNEEMQSANEELQSSNEELQSSNEELETSKEELQSSNEELVTVNEELQARIMELGVANDDLLNVLRNVGSAVVLVGSDLRIRRFSGAAERLLNLVPSDVGRPVSYLGTTLNVPQIKGSVGQSVDEMRPAELRVRCSDGNWYRMRTVPYRSGDQTVRGAVVELTPLPVDEVHGRLMQLNELAGKVLSTLPNQLLVLDHSLRVAWANEAVVQNFSRGLDLFGEPLQALLARDDETQDLWNHIEDAAYTSRTFSGLVVTHTWGLRGHVTLRWSAQCLPAAPDRLALTLLTVENLD